MSRVEEIRRWWLEEAPQELAAHGVAGSERIRLFAMTKFPHATTDEFERGYLLAGAVIDRALLFRDHRGAA
jgi:hypothetical protein